MDIAPLMLERAEANVRAASMTGRVTVRRGDIRALPCANGSFDVVIAEAVTMFADRPHAASELARVCAPGGQVLATEFCWRTPPTAEARRVFLGQVCPGMVFDTIDDWVQIYSSAGLTNVQTQTDPFEMMTPRGFLADEGPAHSLAIMTRVAAARPTSARWPGSCRGWPKPSPTLAMSSWPARNPGDHRRTAQRPDRDEANRSAAAAAQRRGR